MDVKATGTLCFPLTWQNRKTLIPNLQRFLFQKRFTSWTHSLASELGGNKEANPVSLDSVPRGPSRPVCSRVQSPHRSSSRRHLQRLFTALPSLNLPRGRFHSNVRLAVSSLSGRLCADLSFFWTIPGQPAIRGPPPAALRGQSKRTISLLGFLHKPVIHADRPP